MWTSENNWYKWYYSDRKFGRQHGNDKFSTSFSCGYIPTKKTFKEEIILASASILDHYAGAVPSILFSGGADSELILRSFLELKIKPKVYIFRYENDYNIYDVSYAVTICSMLGVDYRIIDFNLCKFFENDAERLSNLAQIDRPRALAYCKFIELIDELPILGSSDLSIMRTDDNYSIPGKWIVRCWEHDTAWSKFILSLNKPAVGEWFKWTPGLVLSYTKTKWCQQLVQDKFPGKLGVNSTKLVGYREAYPDLIERKKKTGFEYTDHLVLEFEEYLKQKNNGLIYRQYFDRSFENLEKEIFNN
jgi:hypothetical protein